GRDFFRKTFAAPVNTVVSANTIQDDGFYGILLYNAPNNVARPFTSQNRNLVKNTFGHNKINFRNFLSGFDIRTRLNTGSKSKSRGQVQHATAHVVHTHGVPKTSVPVRPRVPTLFDKSGPSARSRGGAGPHGHGR